MTDAAIDSGANKFAWRQRQTQVAVVEVAAYGVVIHNGFAGGVDICGVCHLVLFFWLCWQLVWSVIWSCQP